MTTASEKPAVEFTDGGAVYTPGNGHIIEYKRVNGIFYHIQTPDAVVQALESARSRRQRVRIYYGDTQTGRDWHEEHHVEGTIGNSMGPLRVPLLIHSRRSHGGPAILDHCVIRIKLTSGATLYSHPKYHAGTFTVREIGPEDDLRAKGYTHAVDVDGQNHAKSLAAAQRYVKKMVG